MIDLSQSLSDAICEAESSLTLLRIVGSDTKHFLGRQPIGEPIDVSKHAGIISYEPTELSLTVKCGSLISDIQEEINRSGQQLPFEPPNYNSEASIGGTIACGLSGPARPYAGSLRDFLLGITCINGRGEILRFGGQVMKNVAGYDAARLMAGAMGTLGLILDASFKVLPVPQKERTQIYDVDEKTAISWMNKLGGKPLPITGTCFFENELRIRLSGTEASVTSAVKEIGGTEDPNAEKFWIELREQKLPFFENANILWRIIVPPAVDPLKLPGKSLIEWGGGLRWLARYPHEDDSVYRLSEKLGGHATKFRGGDRSEEVEHPLSQQMFTLHHNLKLAFDPAGILNPGRLYREL
tara:strand:+ start:42734 stop:43795 length:1062 start_codon:yes stop_codon:yes gene_type:complete